jgi:hypothetical protein
MKNHHQLLEVVLGTLDQGKEPAKVCILKLILMPLKSGKLNHFWWGLGGGGVHNAVKPIGGGGVVPNAV